MADAVTKTVFVRLKGSFEDAAGVMRRIEVVAEIGSDDLTDLTLNVRLVPRFRNFMTRAFQTIAISVVVWVVGRTLDQASFVPIIQAVSDRLA